MPSAASTLLLLHAPGPDLAPPAVPADCEGWLCAPEAVATPAGWRRMPVWCEAPPAAVSALAERAPGRDLVLLRHGTRLPQHWWPRLRLAAGQDEFDVVGPLDGGVPALDPFAGDPPADRAFADALCWHYGEHALFATDRLSPNLSWWRAAATAKLDANAGHRRGRGLRLGMLPCLYADGGIDSHDPGDQPLLPVRALREGLRGIGHPRLHGLAGADGRPVLLHLLHGWGGGAARFVADLAAADSARRHLVLVAEGDWRARMHGQRLALYADLDAPPLRVWPLARPITATALESDEYRRVLAELRAEWGVGAVLVSSLIGHSLDALRSGLPTALCCHDYYPLWPYLDENFDRGELGPAELRSRLAAAPPPLFAEAGADAWLALRTAFVETLIRHDVALSAPSTRAGENWRRIAPALAARHWHTIGHAQPDWDTPPPAPARRADTRLRVLVPGRIEGGKGEALLAQIVPRLPAGVDLVLLGAGAAGVRFLGADRVHLLADYRQAHLPALVAALAPDLALLPSTVSETWSYTLSEMWRLGVPVLACDRGSFAERIEHGRSGLLVAAEPEAILAVLCELAGDRRPLATLQPGRLPAPEEMAAAWRQALPAETAPFTLAAAGPERVRRLRLECDLAQAQRHVAELEQSLLEQQRELDARADWASDLERRLAELQSHSQAETARLNQALEQARAEADRLHAMLAQAQADRQGLHEALHRAHLLYQTDSADLARQRDVALAQRDALERQLGLMLGSRSWRLTRPLRGLRRLLQGLAARLGFRRRLAVQYAQRGLASVRTRGWRATWRRAREQFVPRHGTPGAAPPAPGEIALALDCPPQPRVSVIVPVYNQLAHTLACLRSLAADRERCAFEVIVVDDHSEAATAQALARVPGLRHHRNERNLGFIGACNAGALLARGEFLAFLNNDTQVRPGWLDALLDTFEQRSDAGLVGTKLIYPDGRLQEAGGIVFADGSAWNYGRFEDPADPRFNFVREADYCSGAAIAIRRELFTELGGFDPRYAPAYYEDTDLAMKVRQRGLKVYYQPRAEVVHHEGVSHGTDPGRGVKAHQIHNQGLFAERWLDALRAGHPAPGAAIGRASRHRARLRVLVVDACTPTPDRDSGSLRMVNLLRLLEEAGCAVSFFADNRAHDGPYTRTLQQLGVEVWWHPWLGNPAGWLQRHGQDFDLALLSRHYIASAYLPLLRQFAPRAKIVFDSVDLHFLREQREAELTADVQRMRQAANTRRQELAVIEQADLSLVVSPVEQALLAREAPQARVEVLSNVHAIAERRAGYDERRGLVFVGGFRHPPNTDAVRWLAEAIFPLIRAELPAVELHLIGAEAPAEIEALGAREGVRFHGYVPDLAPFMDGVRIGLAPLRYGAGVKGKINLSMAHGQPVVATACAVEGMHLREGEDVLVADTPEAFAAAVVRLYRDRALWERLAANGVENVRRHFSFQTAARALEKVLAIVPQDEAIPRRPRHLRPVPDRDQRIG